MVRPGQTVSFLIRICFATVLIIVAGLGGAIAFLYGIEPMLQAFAGPPDSLGWGSPNTHAASMAATAFLSILLTIVIWFVFAPIQQDRRQEIRQERRRP
jgi:hypothetical protein